MWTPSRGTRVSPRVTQFPPHIFNAVVDVIVCHWVGLVMENKAGPDGFGCMVAEKVDFF